MAKKILYKVTAYHCPRCGGITEPTKKYCEYCERDLSIRRDNKTKVRLLIDFGNYIFYDTVRNIEFVSTPSYIEATCLEDTYSRRIVSNYNEKFSVDLLACDRSLELPHIKSEGIHKVRLECLDMDLGYEQECYVGNISETIYSDEMITSHIEFIGVGDSVQGKAIPQEIMDEMRCPNCGAKITSRYGACPYCSGWSEVEWV